MQAKFNQNKKILILTLYLRYDGMVKKTISRYCSFETNSMSFLFIAWYRILLLGFWLEAD
jgi:hypothetical protein